MGMTAGIYGRHGPIWNAKSDCRLRMFRGKAIVFPILLKKAHRRRAQKIQRAL
jgi:hypothetical protein